MNLVDVLAKFARLSPRSPAFVEVRPVSGLRQEITWKEFHDRTNRISNSLLQEDVQRPDKVFLLGRNSIRWLEAYFAILKMGAWAVPLNFRFTDEDILYCAGVAEPSAFIFDEEYGERVKGLRKKLTTVNRYCTIGPDRAEEFVTLEDLVINGSPQPVPVDMSDEDECALYFTSGTTGVPKPVLHGQKALMSVAATEASNHNFVSSDRFLMM